MKRLWLDVNAPELATPPDAGLQERFDAGHRFGKLAHGLFPGGQLVAEGHENFSQALRRTAQLLGDENVPAIFEAAVSGGGASARVDILARLPGRGLQVFEVKSSKSFKEQYDWDVAIQVYAARESGLEIGRAGLVQLNGDYFYEGGEHDPHRLFSVTDRTGEVEAILPKVRKLLRAEHLALESGDPPGIEPDGHCWSPYGCQFWEHCTRDMPEDWVYHLHRLSSARYASLSSLGIRSLSEVPAGSGLLSIRQHELLRAFRTGRARVEGGLRVALSSLGSPPYHYLDFETIMPGVPVYPGTRPFETFPFMFSVATADETSQVRQAHYLHDSKDDPRRAVAEALLDLVPAQGPVLAYSSFEATRISSLANRLPRFRTHLLSLLDRIVDLATIVSVNVSHPELWQGFGLKEVTPVLAPGVSYGGLEIQGGLDASREYLSFVTGETSPADWPARRDGIVKYCSVDTLAMAEIHRSLTKMSPGRPRSGA